MHLSKQHKSWIVILFIIIELVGFVGILTPKFHAHTIGLTAVNLCFVLLVMILFHQNMQPLMVYWMVFVFIFGYAVEVIGVKTGSLFGNYQYGNTLGFKLFDVPIVMGVNWLLLCYTSSKLFEQFKIPDILKAILASVLMVALDFIIEPVAMAFDFWQWKGGLIPMQNYMAWLAIAFVFNILFTKIPKKGINKISNWLLLYLVVFFTTMRLCFTI